MASKWVLMPLVLVATSQWQITEGGSPGQWEVFAFVLPCNETVWKGFDWRALTTIALAGFEDEALINYAHQQGVKVQVLANIAKTSLAGVSKRRFWVRQQVKRVQKLKIDGINLDFEEPLREGSQQAVGLTSLVRELRAALSDAVPGAEVSVDVAWSPNGIDGRHYEYKELAQLAHRIFVMSYDEQSQMWDQPSSNCRARANSPLRQTFKGIRQYLRLGIDPGKIVMGLPWYGYRYECESLEGNVCRIPSVPFRGCNCSDAAGREVAYKDLMTTLDKSGSVTLWDNVSMTPYFNWDNKQFWFDNALSISVKASIARQMGLRGVGMWTANFLDYSDQAQVTRMWNGLRGGL